ncbi:PRORP3, partial [Symbiodinium microadriaticum]
AKWATFKAWIRDRKPSLTIDVVIDGANVGYYQQNFGAASGYIDYFQLDAMVRRLQHIGRHPLLILHCRHVFSDIPDMYQDVIKSWRSQNILHVTPAGCNDDTFWLYLAVLLGCDVVTNDEMRDHHFQMLSPRWFVRWKERHQIHFDFGKMSTVDLGGGRSTRMRDVELSLPLPYSHRMQIYAAEAEVISVDIEKDYAQGASGYLIPAVDCEDWLCIIPAERDRQSAELS